MEDTVANADQTETVEVIDGAGIYAVGSFLGIKRPAPYDIDGSKGVSGPKIGLDVDGDEVTIVCKDERELFEFQRDHARGSFVTLRVYPRSTRNGLRYSTFQGGGATWE